jgi:hypothetical protein
MEDYIDIIIICVAALAVIIIIHLLFRRKSNKLTIALDDMQAIHKFVEFLFIHEKKNVLLDITLPNDLLEEFKINRSLSFSCSYHTGNVVGGYHIVFVLNDNHASILAEPDRIVGSFMVLHQQNPITGWYKIELPAK